MATAKDEVRERIDGFRARLQGRWAAIEAADSPTATEWVAMASVVVAGTLLTAWVARDTWFFGDAWGYLTRKGSIQDVLFTPHNGHLTVPAAALYWLLRHVVGLDFWPWHFLPRLIGYSMVAIAIWWTVRCRGTAPEMAALTGVAVSIMGASGFLTTAGVGNFIVLSLAIPALHLVDSRPRPSNRVLGTATLVLLALLLSASLTLAICMGMLIAAAATRHRWKWFLPPVVALAPYTAWYLTLGGTNTDLTVIDELDLFTLPELTLSVLSISYSRFVGLAQSFGPLLVACCFIVLLLAFRRGRMGYFEWTFLGTLTAYIGMFIVVRVLTGHIPLGATRYGYNIVLLSLPLMVPLAPRPSSTALRIAAATLATLLIVPSNLMSLVKGLNYWEARSIEVRDATVAASGIIGAGEPHWLQQRIPVTHAGTFADAAELADEVLAQNLPPPPDATIELVRQAARIHWQSSPPRGTLAIEDAIGGCVDVRRGQTAVLSGRGRDGARIEYSALTRLDIKTLDPHGVGRTSNIAPRGEWLTVAPGVARISIEITVERGAAHVCES